MSVCLASYITQQMLYLGVAVPVATRILKRMESEGFVKAGGKAKRYVSVNNVLDLCTIRMEIHIYFSWLNYISQKKS